MKLPEKKNVKNLTTFVLAGRLRVNKNVSIQSQLSQVLEQYPDFISDNIGTTTVIQARIDTDEGKLVNLPPYRVPDSKLEQTKAEIETLVNSGILVKHESKWSSPMLVVPKKDGGVSIVGLQKAEFHHTPMVCTHARTVRNPSKSMQDPCFE